MVTQRCSDLTHIPTLSLSHLLGHRRCRAPMDLTVLIRVFYFHSTDCEYCYRNRENHFLMAFFGWGFVVIYLPCVLQIKHYILGVSYLLPIIGFLPRVSSSSQDQTSASGSTSRQPNDPPPLKVQTSAPSTLCIDHYFAQSKKPTRKRKKNDAQRPATRSNEFVAYHKGYNHIDVAPHPQPTHQHSSDSNTELHDSQEAVAHHVVSQGLNPCSNQRADVSVPQNETHANNNEITDCHREQTSASGSTSRQPNDPPPLKVPTNSPSNLCIDDYFAQSNNPTRKRKKNDAQRPVTCSNEFVACHKGYNHISVAPHPQPTHQHSSDSNTELHHSHEVVAHHVVSQGLNPSTGCPSSTSNVSLQDEVFKNKRPKITQHTRFQSSQRADAGIPQNETHTNNNEVTDCRRGGQCTNVAPDPQAPQHHATTSNTEAHESHQDANNHFAAENLHSPSCSTSDFGKRLSQNKRPKRKQPASCTSTSRPTGDATHNVRQRLRTQNLAGSFMSCSTPVTEGPSVSPLPGSSPSYEDLGDCDQRCRYCGAAFCENGNSLETQDKYIVVEEVGPADVYDQWVAPSVFGPSPKPRFESINGRHAAVVIDEKMYIFGGNHNGHYISNLHVWEHLH
ncbi:hypothetical protein CTI12_AA542400 [Artemisia annua]|uniref:Uncharacterized protein n=1 Tax=Artemisia annua TaxID=35608 RepID=A0A2U1L0U6_ARTAN|nr:hypothetical protein CTI12_AA542400 [Artemisia annua]